MRIKPLTSLPAGGPDAVPITNPPGFLQIGASNALLVNVVGDGSSASVTPFFWSGGVWLPLSGDATSGVKSVSVDGTVTSASACLPRAEQSMFIALMLTGTVTSCDVSEAMIDATPSTPASSSGSSVTVTNFPATQAVTGPLTDIQLRATPVPVSGSLALSGMVDVSDKPARQVGVVYGSQGQPIKQTATNYNNQVELANGGTLYDARQTRVLTPADQVTTVPSGTQAVSAAALPLPSGAATSALQASGNTSLASIDSKLTNPLPVSGSIAVTGPIDVSDRTARVLGVVSVSGTTAVSATSLPLPTNAAQETGGNLAAINAKTPALGIATAAASVPSVLASDQPAVASKAAIGAYVDGSSVTMGSTTDAETAAGNGSQVSILKRIRTLLSGSLTVAQTAASALKAQITGAGTAGTPDAGVVTVQGVSGGQAIPVSGTVSTSGSTADVTDRAGRLLGVVYGSLAQQLKQTATNFNLAAEIFVSGTAVDPRAVRALTSSDVVTVVQTTAANMLATVTQGAAAALANAWPFKLTDGTSVVAVKASSTAAVAADAAAVVSVSPNSLIPMGGTISAANSSSVLLAPSASFTGTFVSVVGWNEVDVFVYATDTAPVQGGSLTVQWSADGTTVHDNDGPYVIPSGNGQQLSFGPKVDFVRVVYTNNASVQLAFQLRTTLRLVRTRSSTVRIGDTFNDDQDAELQVASMRGRDASGVHRTITVDSAGVLAISQLVASSSSGGVATAVSASISTQIFVASSTRIGGMVFSDTQVVNINVGAAASATAYSDQVTPGGTWTIPDALRQLPIFAWCASACNLQVTGW